MWKRPAGASTTNEPPKSKMRHACQKYRTKYSETHPCITSLKICNKHFQCLRYLRTHIKRHAGVKKFECSICGWRFFEGHKLKFHLESHKEEGQRNFPYECEWCGRTFANRAAWSDHCNTHSGARPFACDVCSATFSHRVGLRRHRLTHEAVKPYCCDMCNKTFAVKPKLKEHLTTHTGVSEHICPHCHKVFTAGFSLRRHLTKCTERGVSVNSVDPTIPTKTLLKIPAATATTTAAKAVSLLSSATFATNSSSLLSSLLPPPPPSSAASLLPSSPLSSCVGVVVSEEVLKTEVNQVYQCGTCGMLFVSLQEAEQHAALHDTAEPENASAGFVEFTGILEQQDMKGATEIVKHESHANTESSQSAETVLKEQRFVLDGAAISAVESVAVTTTALLPAAQSMGVTSAGQVSIAVVSTAAHNTVYTETTGLNAHVLMETEAEQFIVSENDHSSNVDPASMVSSQPRSFYFRVAGSNRKPVVKLFEPKSGSTD